MNCDEVTDENVGSFQDGLTEAGWNDNQLSAQQIEARLQEKQVAALKRERAMMYAKTQQVCAS